MIDASEFQFVIVDPSGSPVVCGPAVELALLHFHPEASQFVTVRTGAHWGPVTVITAAYDVPPELGAGWQDIAEVTVRCQSGLSVTELMGEASLALCRSGGEYRVRVSATGRSDAADLDYDELDGRDQTDPSEQYLIEAWPAAMSDATVLRVPGPAAAAPTDGSVDDEQAVRRRREQDAPAAGARISSDLAGADGCRELSGDTGTVRITMTVPRPIDRLWQRVAIMQLTNLDTQREIAVGNEFLLETFSVRSEGFVGSDGAIRCRWTELVEPTRVALEWQWVSRLGGPDGGSPQPRLPHVASVDVTLQDTSSTTENPEVSLSLVHSGIPVEWVQDMSAVWRSRIDVWAYQSRPTKLRKR